MVNPFQFQAYQSSAPQTIADLMARRGEIAARGAQASGQARAAAIANIGQGAAGELAKYQQEQKDAPIRALQTQQLQQSVTEGQQKIDAGKRAVMGQQVLAAAVKQFSDNPEQVVKFVTANGFPELAEPYVKAQETLRTLKQGQIKDQESADAVERDVLQGGFTLPPERRPAYWIANLGYMKAHGVNTSGLSPIWDDAQAQEQLAHFPAEKPIAVNAGDNLVSPTTFKPLYTAPAKAPNSQEAEFQLDGKGPTVKGSYVPGVSGAEGKYLYRGEDVTARVTKQPSAAMVNLQMGQDSIGGDVDASRPDPKTANKIDPKTGQTPNAIYQNALTFALKGTLPSMGNGTNPVVRNARSGIQNKAAAIAAQAGIDLPTLQAEYRANAGTLNKLLPQYTATATAANTATDNLQLALDQSAKVPRTGSPLVNRYVQWAGGHTLSGNAELTRLETYIYTAAREYAKVTSGGAASAQGLTDSASKEAEKLINAAQTPDQFGAAVDAMQHDMANVTANQTKTIANVSSTIANFLSVAHGVNMAAVTSEPPKPPAPSGVIYARDPQGGLHQAKAGTKLPDGWKLEAH